MSGVSNVNNFEQLGLTAQSTASSSDLGQEDFLNLMITQLRNQDPFKPMESGEFLGQLASFGTVDGIRALQDSVAALSGSLTSNQALQAASLLDRNVLFASDAAPLGVEGGVSGAVELGNSATQVVVGIYTTQGELVRRLDLGTQAAGRAEFTWDGLDESGRRMQSGTYAVRAEAISGSMTQAAQVLVRANVDNVTLGSLGEPLTIGIQGLGDVDFSYVRQIG